MNRQDVAFICLLAETDDNPARSEYCYSLARSLIAADRLDEARELCLYMEEWIIDRCTLLAEISGRLLAQGRRAEGLELSAQVVNDLRSQKGSSPSQVGWPFVDLSARLANAGEVELSRLYLTESANILEQGIADSAKWGIQEWVDCSKALCDSAVLLGKLAGRRAGLRMAAKLRAYWRMRATFAILLGKESWRTEQLRNASQHSRRDA